MARPMRSVAIVATTAVAGGAWLRSAPPFAGEVAIPDQLFWWMAGAAAVIWGVAVATLLYVALGRRESERSPWPFRILVGGGVALPAVTLAAMLSLAVPPLSALANGRTKAGAPRPTPVAVGAAAARANVRATSSSAARPTRGDAPTLRLRDRR